jgi:hypothetical protein
MEDFDPVNKTLLFCGKRCSGKSFLIKHLLSCHKKWKKTYLICPTENVNSFYTKDGVIPKENVMDEYDEEWVEALITNMTKINANKTKKDATNVLLILDDCVTDVNFHQSKALKKLYSRGRHIFITVIMTTQYLYSIPPIARNNTDYVFVGMLNKQSLALLSDEYMSGSIEKPEFLEMYHSAVKEYGFFVINNNSVKDGDNIDEIYGECRTPAECFK